MTPYEYATRQVSADMAVFLFCLGVILGYVIKMGESL